jgi:hypothetical protein
MLLECDSSAFCYCRGTEGRALLRWRKWQASHHAFTSKVSALPAA